MPLPGGDQCHTLFSIFRFFISTVLHWSLPQKQDVVRRSYTSYYLPPEILVSQVTELNRSDVTSQVFTHWPDLTIFPARIPQTLQPWNTARSFHRRGGHETQWTVTVERWPQSRTELSQYTGCHWRKGPNFGRVFLMLKYTDITQNTYIQSWTVTEIMAREKRGHLAFPRSIRLQLYREPPLPVGHLTACRAYVG